MKTETQNTTFTWKNLCGVMGFYRRSLNLTKGDLAKSLGVAPSIVGYWERGVKEPKATNLMKLSRALGITETELLHPSDEVKEKIKEMELKSKAP